MSELYTQLYNRIGVLRDAGFDPDRVVIPADEWRGVKDQATVNGGEGVFGGDETLVNGVLATWSDTLSSARVIFELDGDD